MALLDYTRSSIKRSTKKGDAPIRRGEIMGLPLQYTELTDPNARVFNNTLMSDVPIVTFKPGKPMFLGMDNADTSQNEEELIRSMVNGRFEEDDEEGITNFLVDKNITDFRYYGFASDYTQYFKYVQLMLSKLHVKMGLGMMYNFSEDYTRDFLNGGSLSYYADRNLSVSESADNSFAESSLSSSAKGISSKKRELDFILGKNTSHGDVLGASAGGEGLVGKVANLAGDILSTAESLLLPSFGGINKTETLINGSHLAFPQVWEDSTYSKNYTIHFKFYSPYGDKSSIFHRVYVPFISLLALTLPKQDTIMGYASPFIVKMESPGFFNCDMGYISSISFKKGGDEDLWSIDGLPLEITVDISVKDLYPTLMMSNSYTALVTNPGLHQFLDTMAGVSFNDITLGTQISSYIGEHLNKILNIPTYLKNRMTDFYDNKVLEKVNSGRFLRFLP